MLNDDSQPVICKSNIDDQDPGKSETSGKESADQITISRLMSDAPIEHEHYKRMEDAALGQTSMMRSLLDRSASQYKSGIRVGVFIDSENITRNGGKELHYGVLRQFAERGGAHVARMNIYMAVDHVRMETDQDYAAGVRRYQQNHVQLFGGHIIEKSVRWQRATSGERVSKANADIDIAVDALRASERLDEVILVTGDGDFIPLIQDLQKRGIRVSVIGFHGVSIDIRAQADEFYSGYMIPGLVPTGSHHRWGMEGSRVRGVCERWDDVRKFGFITTINGLQSPLWAKPDVRFYPDTPAEILTVFFHVNDLPSEVDPSMLPNRDIIFEYTLEYRMSQNIRRMHATAIEVKMRYDRFFSYAGSFLRHTDVRC